MRNAACFAASMIFSLEVSAHQAIPQPVFSSGQWAVMRADEGAAGGNRCTAIYKGNSLIQASTGDVHVGTRVGVAAYTFRVDNRSETEGHTFSGTERAQAARLDIGGLGLLDAQRLALKVQTTIGTTVTEEIDLNGLRPAFEYMAKEGCRQ